MKKQMLKFGAAMFIVAASFAITSCGGEDDKKKDDKKEEKSGEKHEAHASYQCPMKCEGEKTYDAEGKCPTCGMDLEEIEHAH